jgi:hypothetical protein
MSMRERWLGFRRRLASLICPELLADREEALHERAEAVNQVLDQYRTIEDIREVSRDRANALRAALRAAPDVAPATCNRLWVMDMTNEQREGALREVGFFRPDGVVIAAGGAT